MRAYRRTEEGAKSTNYSLIIIWSFIIIFLVAGTNESSYAKDKSGKWMVRANISCGEYLDAYSRAELNDDTGYSAQSEALRAFGWVSGFISAYNAIVVNDHVDVVEDMTNNDVYRWIASWCRDNSSKDIAIAVWALIQNRLSQ